MGVLSVPFKFVRRHLGLTLKTFMCFVDQEENHATKVVKEPCFTMVANYENLNDQDSDQVDTPCNKVKVAKISISQETSTCM